MHYNALLADPTGQAPLSIDSYTLQDSVVCQLPILPPLSAKFAELLSIIDKTIDD